MCGLYTQKRKAPHAGEVACGAKKRTPGKIVRSPFFEEPSLERYLETRVGWIAASCARASRASMGAKLTLPPRRRLTRIPASCTRSLAMPCALGRISVTVDLAITDEDKATAVPADAGLANQRLIGKAGTRLRTK
jgi:hypothetical protein